MTSYCLDVEMFISEVKKYPEIWDLNSEDHRYKSRKQRAWSDVAKVFITDFDNIPEVEKNDVYRKLHSKWRNIRDSYARHVKKRDGKKGYMYAKNLSFLNELYKQRSQSSSDAEDDQTEESWQSDEVQMKIKKLNYKRRRFDISNDADIWAGEVENQRSTVENLKRKINKRNKQNNDIEYVDTHFGDANCSFNAEDEDRSFFESLLPAVREFNMDQKLEFRSDVITLIKKIRCMTPNDRKFKLDPATGDFDE